MKTYGSTDKGLVRKTNQDSYVIAANECGDLFCVVCDGIGGSKGGDVASSTAVRYFSMAFSETKGFSNEKELFAWLKQHIRKANDEIFTLSTTRVEYRGMGTTMVALLLTKAGNYVINIGYERVSTDSQIDGYGLDTQEDALMTYAKNQSFKNFVIFEDQGETGTKMDRPAINAIKRLITAFNVGGSQIKVASFTIPKIDRLSRTSLGTLQFIQDYIVPQKDAKDSRINRNKEIIEFHSCNESFVSVKKDDSTGNMMLQIFAALAEYDRNEIVKKLSTGKKKRMESKKWPGGSPPFGFTYNYKTGKLEIKEDEAEIVREIFRLYINKKMPPEKIAKHYVPLLGPSFTEKRVRDILTREMYAGVLTYGEFRAEEAYESIIGPETFARAQMEKRRSLVPSMPNIR